MTRIGSMLRQASLLLVCAATLEAQTPSGITRELKCRGKPNIDLRIDREPSPRDPRFVAMVLRYERPPRTRAFSQEGMGLVDHGAAIQWAPGTCTWNTMGLKEIPPEPGVVYFDLPRDAQSWARPGSRDTTIDAARLFPDVATLPRYLADSSRYWVFFVDDATNFSNSFGAWPRGGGLAIAAPPATTDSAVGRAAGPVTKASPVRSDPPLPGARPPGNPTAATAAVARAPLKLEGVITALDRFVIRFSARANASPTVRYSTEKPVGDPRTGRWSFPGGVLQGSGAVEAGVAARVVKRSTQGFRAQYTASSRLTPERGRLYYYIITVPGGPDVPQEQYAGQLTTTSQTVRATITTFTVLRSSIGLSNLHHDFLAWTDSAGTFRACDNGPCVNAGNRLRLLVYAKPRLGPNTGALPTWTSLPGVNTGIARREFDLRTIPDTRPLRAFTLRSEAGAIEFEVQGTLEVVRR